MTSACHPKVNPETSKCQPYQIGAVESCKSGTMTTTSPANRRRTVSQYLVSVHHLLVLLGHVCHLYHTCALLSAGRMRF